MFSFTAGVLSMLHIEHFIRQAGETWAINKKEAD
jgi:hypothetical protein